MTETSKQAIAASVTPAVYRGSAALKLVAKGGASAVVTLFGAQLMSWRDSGGCERIFCSERAIFDGRTPIRGGVPICFPQFSTLGALPRHGLVRTRPWMLNNSTCEDGAACVSLRLPADPDLRAAWPYDATVSFTVRLDESGLQMTLGVDNIGDVPLSFTGALHSYFLLVDLEATRIFGLCGSSYRDATKEGLLGQEVEEALVICDEVDRIYQSVPRDLVLREQSRALRIRATNFPDVVVWNPGPEKCRALADMNPEAWRTMVCIEAGAISVPISVAPGEAWQGSQALSALD